MLPASWSPAQRRHAAREMVLGALISAALSIFFVYLGFGGANHVPVEALIWDALPQSFMIVLMGSLVPGLLARAKIIKGGIAGRGEETPSAGRICCRAAGAAAAATVIGWGLHALLLTVLVPDGMRFSHILLLKAVYGALLGALALLLMMRFLFGSGGEHS